MTPNRGMAPVRRFLSNYFDLLFVFFCDSETFTFQKLNHALFPLNTRRILFVFARLHGCSLSVNRAYIGALKEIRVVAPKTILRQIIARYRIVVGLCRKQLKCQFL